LTNSTYALATTGYAGPDAGTEANPAGTVYIGLVGPNQAKARRLQFAGDRTRVRMLAATSALDYLRRNPG
jgi:PncC family amidohydrolase